MMPTPLLIGLGVVGSVAAVNVAWRFASRRASLPCPVWLRWFVELDNPFTSTNRSDVIVHLLGLRPGMRVLDVGCGPGRVTVPIARAVGPDGEVVAIDVQPGMLKRARQRADAEGLTNVRFLQTHVGHGALDVQPADRAVLVTVLGEIPDREAALQAIFDALKPGGYLSVTEIVFDPHFQTRATVTRLAQAIGFRDKAFYGNRIAYTLHLEKRR
jgi:ubiquinone/menaquinone biosynthesis C-methylase UbiE